MKGRGREKISVHSRGMLPLFGASRSGQSEAVGFILSSDI